MINFNLVMLILPLLTGPQMPAAVDTAKLQVGAAISAAAEAATAYQPGWLIDAHDKLGEDPGYCREVIDGIHHASEETGIDAELIWAVMYTESRGHHYTRRGNVKRGGAGEIGAMQVLPFWRRGLKKEYGIEVDLYNVQDNIRASAYILTRGGTERNVILSYYNTGQRYNSTPYQRKVERYISELEQLEADRHGAEGRVQQS